MNTETVAAMADVLLPDDPEIAPDERRRLVAIAGALIQLRIGQMSGGLHLGVHGLLWLLRLLALPCLGGPFHRCGADRRRQFLDRAERWRALHFDDLIRLIRSLAFLAYYDDPVVRRRIGFVP